MSTTQQSGNEMQHDSHQLVRDLTSALSLMCDCFFSRELEWEGVEIHEIAINALDQGNAFLDNFKEN
jgi:hypothetical protein